MSKSILKATLSGTKQALVVELGSMPLLQKDEALIQVKAAALNRRDWWIQQGQYAGLKFPIVPGSDGSGIVTEVANAEDEHWIGQSVIINPSMNWGDTESHQGSDFNILGLPTDGTLAEYVKVPVKNLHVKPAHLSFEEAAAIPLVGLTTYRALFSRAALKPGERLLITGIGGGAATMALQFALAVNSEVYVTSSAQHKIERAKLAGARGGVNYTHPNWAETLLQDVGQFNVILDSALGEQFKAHLELSKPGGRIVFFGGTAGDLPELQARRIFWKQLSIIGSTMGSPADFKNMLLFLNKHTLKPVIDQVFSLQEVNQAFQRLNDPDAFGKVVIRVKE